MEREHSAVEDFDIRLYETAAHEEGHALVAENLGGVVYKRTVVPEGNTLGHAIVSFLGFDPQERLMRLMATLCGGIVAERIIGESDHHGAGSDMAQLDRLAGIMSHILYDGKVAAEHFKYQAFSMARSSIQSRDVLLARARRLAILGTIV